MRSRNSKSPQMKIQTPCIPKLRPTIENMHSIHNLLPDFCLMLSHQPRKAIPIWSAQCSSHSDVSEGVLETGPLWRGEERYESVVMYCTTVTWERNGKKRNDKKCNQSGYEREAKNKEKKTYHIPHAKIIFPHNRPQHFYRSLINDIISKHMFQSPHIRNSTP